MKPIIAIVLAVLCLTPITVRAAAPPPKDISALLAPIIQKHNVPGMAAAVVQGGETVALGVAGVRTRGKPDKIAAADRFHIGSDTKTMTAMLCGILVDEGKLKWSQTLGETFPELKKSMNPQYQAVTLEQLLTHRGGAPGAIEKDQLWGQLWQHTGTPTSARRLLLEGVTSKPPEAPPGTKFIYSNAGVSIAGHMAEKITGKSWEDLMREKIFRPLGMTTAGFGAPGTPAKNDQPRGHKADGSPVEPGPAADNPVAIGPAGIVHCSIGDWAKFAVANLPSAKTKLVKPETLQKLHTPVPPAPGEPKYAMGWIIADNQPWAGGPALTHSGSNTMWFAVVWLAPEKDFAVLVACNQANAEACNDAAVALITDHFGGVAQAVDYPKRAPFTGIRWEGDKPVVKIGQEWFTLVSLDGIAADQIVAFSQRTYTDKGRMRFEEDLVEVLTRMGHEPKDTVQLVVSPVGSRATRTLENVPMTEANRAAIKAAATAQERGN